MAIQTQAFYTTPLNDDPTKRIITTGEEFERFVRFLTGKPLVVDYETTGTAWHAHARACGVALASWDDNGVLWNAYVPFRHESPDPQLDIGTIGPAVQRLLGDESTLKIAHNLKFEDHISRVEGWKIRGPRYDTMIAARFYDENLPIALKSRADSDLGYTNAAVWEKTLDREIARLAKWNRMGLKAYKYQYGYSQVGIPVCGIYACWDTQFAGQLYQKYESWGLSSYYERLWPNEMALTEVICDMEEAGLKLDVEYTVRLRDKVRAVKGKLVAELATELGSHMFELGSDDQLRNYMVNVLGLQLWKLTRGKKYAVDRDVLEHFKDQAPVLGKILDWRDADKIDTTYATSLLRKVDDHGFVHPDFQQVGTNTGRLSCKEPNFQNFTSENKDRAKEHGMDHDPFSVRRAFPALSPEKPRLYMDYSQIELRVLAWYSQDPIMVQAFIDGEDLHDRTSQEVFHTKDKEKRRLAKVINFGLSYCMTEKGFSRNAKIPEAEAKQYLDKFFERYHGIADFRRSFWHSIRENNSQFRNAFGRNRRVPNIVSDNDWERGRAERQAIGSLIQGTAAELTRESLVRVWRWIREENVPAKIVNTVHDEIQIDVLDDAWTPRVAKQAKILMEDFPMFAPVPVIVDGEITRKTWADKEDLPIE